MIIKAAPFNFPAGYVLLMGCVFGYDSTKLNDSIDTQSWTIYSYFAEVYLWDVILVLAVSLDDDDDVMLFSKGIDDKANDQRIVVWISLKPLRLYNVIINFYKLNGMYSNLL